MSVGYINKQQVRSESSLYLVHVTSSYELARYMRKFIHPTCVPTVNFFYEKRS